MKFPRSMFVTAGCFALALATAGPLGACAYNPTTGKNQFVGMTQEQEVAAGLSAKPQITEEFGGEVPDAELRKYVDTIGRTLLPFTAENTAKGSADYASLPWEFTFLNSDVINAFALPGGKVFITRGLASRLTNEAQMAGVIGHEMGHVTARHGAQRVAKNAFAQGVLELGGMATDSEEIQQLGSVVADLTLKGYSREEENEADSLGIRYMVRAGYNPMGQVQVMKILAEASGPSAGGLAEWTATHPDPLNRVKRLQAEIATSYPYTQTDKKYQFHEQRFQTQFKKRLALLPVPPQTIANSPTVAFRLDQPATWCGHCAAAAIEGKSPVSPSAGQ